MLFFISGIVVSIAHIQWNNYGVLIEIHKVPPIWTARISKKLIPDTLQKHFSQVFLIFPDFKCNLGKCTFYDLFL